MPVSNIDVLDALGVSRNVNAPNSNGQANMAGSRSVVIASDQSAVPVSLASLPALATGGNVIGGVTQSGTWNIGTVTTVSTVTNLAQFGGAAINLGAGAVSTGTLRITQASDSPLVTAAGAVGDAVWASGNGSQIALLKTLATAALSTSPSPVSIDQTTPGTTNRIALPELTNAANVAKTYTGSFTVAGTALTRPANVTPYSIGDSISNNGTAASVTTTAVTLSDTNDHPIDLAEILLDTTDTGPGTAGATIRLHLYNADYTASTGVQAGDNVARSQKRNGWVGSFSGAMQPFFDGSRARLIADTGNLLMAVPVTGAKTFYWELETRTAFTPSANSTTFTPTFKGFQARPA